MPVGPVPIPFPLSSFPGLTPQESAGRLINCHAEPLGANGPSQASYHRSPGLTLFATTSNTGYRGGLVVNNLAFETWANNASTVTPGGVVTSLGTLPGTLKVSIARNQNGAGPDVVACDIGNGPFVLQAAGVPQSPPTVLPVSTLPTPKSVCFQDGYFHFLSANSTLFASPINALSPFNSLTFVTLTAKADVVGQRVIPFSGLIFAFTTGHCEVFQDTAQAFPAYPYTRQIVLNWGLLQENAIAGFETGFDDLLWVAQDFGVYRLPYGSLAPSKVSPPDLDRLIEKQNRLGNILEASCYIIQGKKFWVLSSPGGTWEFNLGSSQWNERTSLNLTTFVQDRWRASGGHPAFGKWIVGDAQSGNLGFVDDTVLTEFGSPQLRRIESAPVNSFPDRLRVARADFSFSTGAGIAVNNFRIGVTGASLGTNGAVRLTLAGTTFGFIGNLDTVIVSGVIGTTEANGTWTCLVIDAIHIELQGSHFSNAYVSGGIVTDITSAPNVQNPSVAISWSDDNGINWRNPVVRSLGLQGKSLRTRVTVKNTGYSGPQARRWRLDDTDCIAPFMSATQDEDPKEK